MDDLKKLLENAGVVTEVYGQEFNSAGDMLKFMKSGIDKILSDFESEAEGNAEYAVDDLYALKGVIDNASVKQFAVNNRNR